jgi:hypothetical protein
MTTHAQAPPVRLPVAGPWLWTAWVALTALGALVGELLLGLLGSLLFSIAPPSLSLTLIILLGALLLAGSGLLLWFPVGLAQGLVLCWMIPGFKQRALKRWILISAIAASGALILSAPLFYFTYFMGYAISYSSIYGSDLAMILILLCFVSIGVTIGVVFGLSQSALLGQYMFVPGWWLITTLLAWGLAVPVNVFLLDRLFYPMAGVFVLMAPIYGALSGFDLHNVLAGVLVIALPAAVTGLALPRLMTPPTLRPSGPDLPRLLPE